MSDRVDTGPLHLGETAPNFVLDAITREGKIAIDDYRGQKPVLVGLYRGLHCPFCRRHIAAISQLTPTLNNKGIESLTVVNTPLERARLYFRYHPMPALIAASDPERTSQRAFGLPNMQITDEETLWPHKATMSDVKAMRIEPARRNARADESVCGARIPEQERRLRADRSGPASYRYRSGTTRRTVPA